MPKKKITGKILLAAGAVILLLLVLANVFGPVGTVTKVIPIKINDSVRFNAFFLRATLGFAILYFGYVISSIAIRKIGVDHVKSSALSFFSKIAQLFSFKTLAIILGLYIVVLFAIGVKQYDLGTDEVNYVMYAQSFYEHGFAFSSVNGTIYIVDNYAMLPVYVLTSANFILHQTEVWHFKFTAVILSVIFLGMAVWVVRKLYGTNTAIFFVFLLAVMPGFGFMTISFFGEVVQAGFMFLGAYIWLSKAETVSRKNLVITGLLFAIALQTKVQLLQPLVLTLIIFHFIDRSKKPLWVLLYSIVFLFVLAGIRFIPAYFYNSSYLPHMIKFWYLEIIGQSSKSIVVIIDRIQVFNRFFPIPVFAGFSVLIYVYRKTLFEKFMFLFSVSFILWYVFYFHLTNYRVLFMGLIPFAYLMAVSVFRLYEEYKDKPLLKMTGFKYFTAAAILFVMFWGASTNLIYAYIGYNDGVQFDLDGNKNRLFWPIQSDNSQKDFFAGVKSTLNPADTVYVASGGQGAFVTQFYLGEKNVYDIRRLEEAVKNMPQYKRYVVIDRIGYPLGLEAGYKVLDKMNLSRTLVLKNGDFELYQVTGK